jgi:tetratricopeptide (TPR) repeat protein
VKLPDKKTIIPICILLAGVLLTYSNHFQNSFHFDDSHTVVDNPYIRDLRNLPRLFTDANTFSVLPANRGYRPLVTASLAFDYWLGGGLQPFYFHVSTSVWFLAQLILMFVLFKTVCDRVRPHPANYWISLFAVALYGLHPAVAETVNYVIQRGDIFSTAGVIAGLVIYASFPRHRRTGLYLIPVVAALLSKPPALVFPVLLFLYIRFFEVEDAKKAFQRCVPSLIVTGVFAFLNVVMTPQSYTPGASSAFAYRLTQPLVALRYFRTFFIPNRLTADTDLAPLKSFLQADAWLGFIFLAAIIVLAIRLSYSRDWHPTAFGLWWFLVALAPTSIFPLAEVENDHRMYFPFVGLALAVCWPVGRLVLMRQHVQRSLVRATAAACILVLFTCAWATWRRNEVWRTEESLWYDVTLKSPRNGRGLMNYGLTQMQKGETHRALDYFERAATLLPSYYFLEINRGIANGALNRDAAAERHFLRAIMLAPDQADNRYFYARWLDQKQRRPEAIAYLQQAMAANADYLPARYLLMNIYARQADWPNLRAVAESTLARFPSDTTAATFLARAASPPSPGSPVPAPAMTPEEYLNLSLSHHGAGKFEESIDAARRALELRPGYAEAYNNISAAYAAMGRWDPAIEAAREAIRIRPDFELAKNNLAWAEEQKRKTTAK